MFQVCLLARCTRVTHCASLTFVRNDNDEQQKPTHLLSPVEYQSFLDQVAEKNTVCLSNTNAFSCQVACVHYLTIPCACVARQTFRLVSEDWLRLSYFHRCRQKEQHFSTKLRQPKRKPSAKPTLSGPLMPPPKSLLKK